MELTRPGAAASSQLRWSGFGISWLDLTSAISARPPKLVSKPQMRCSGSSIVSLWPSEDSSSTERQCATTSSPGFQALTPGPVRSTTPARSEPMTWYGRSWRLVSSRERAVALQEAEGRHRLEDRGPDRVVVDGGGHDGHQRLARAELGHRHVVEVERLAGVLVPGVEAGEHLRLVLVHGDRAVGLGERQSGEVGGRWLSGDWIASRISFTVVPPAMRVPGGTLRGYVGAGELLCGWRWCRRFGGGGARQRLVAREVACDAGVRARRPGGVCGDSRRTEVLCTPAARTPSTYGTACQSQDTECQEFALR